MRVAVGDERMVEIARAVAPHAEPFHDGGRAGVGRHGEGDDFLIARAPVRSHGRASPVRLPSHSPGPSGERQAASRSPPCLRAAHRRHRPVSIRKIPGSRHRPCVRGRENRGRCPRSTPGPGRKWHRLRPGWQDLGNGRAPPDRCRPRGEVAIGLPPVADDQAAGLGQHVAAGHGRFGSGSKLILSRWPVASAKTFQGPGRGHGTAALQPCNRGLGRAMARATSSWVMLAASRAPISAFIRSN